jgi:hypothetical protein
MNRDPRKRRLSVGRPRMRPVKHMLAELAVYLPIPAAEGQLERAAPRDMSDEQKRKLLSQVHVLVDRWRLFMAEIVPLFADFQRPRSSKAAEREVTGMQYRVCPKGQAFKGIERCSHDSVGSPDRTFP